MFATDDSFVLVPTVYPIPILLKNLGQYVRSKSVILFISRDMSNLLYDYDSVFYNVSE